MSIEEKREIVLSIETAIQGGSLSLLENGKELDFWIGQTEVSKAEDVLEQIQVLFERNDFKKEALKLIAVSAGAGSSTGIKIGLAIAKGLKKAFNSELIELSVLESLLLMTSIEVSGTVITALPIGKDLISWQVFGSSITAIDKSATMQVSTVLDFLEHPARIDCVQIVCHHKIFSLLSGDGKLPDKISLIDAGINIAKLNGIKAASEYLWV